MLSKRRCVVREPAGAGTAKEASEVHGACAYQLLTIDQLRKEGHPGRIMILYHGTTQEAYERIRIEGFKYVWCAHRAGRQANAPAHLTPDTRTESPKAVRLTR